MLEREESTDAVPDEGRNKRLTIYVRVLVASVVLVQAKAKALYLARIADVWSSIEAEVDWESVLFGGCQILRFQPDFLVTNWGMCDAVGNAPLESVVYSVLAGAQFSPRCDCQQFEQVAEGELTVLIGAIFPRRVVTLGGKTD